MNLSDSDDFVVCLWRCCDYSNSYAATTQLSDNGIVIKDRGCEIRHLPDAGARIADTYIYRNPPHSKASGLSNSVVKPRHVLAHLVTDVESGSVGGFLFGGVENYFQRIKLFAKCDK